MMWSGPALGREDTRDDPGAGGEGKVGGYSGSYPPFFQLKLCRCAAFCGKH